MVMFVMFALLLLLIAKRWRAQLKEMVGMVVGYMTVMSGLCAAFEWLLPSPPAVRVLVAGCMILLVALAATRKRLRDTTVKAITLYFLCLITLSTFAQWITEAEREVTARRPVLETTVISRVQQDGTQKELRREVHTYTEEFTYTGETLIDCWFNAVSPACVTGLISTDFSKFTLAGQIIVLLTIQAGGLGIIFFTAFIGFLVTRGKSTRSRLPGMNGASKNGHVNGPVNGLPNGDAHHAQESIPMDAETPVASQEDDPEHGPLDDLHAEALDVEKKFVGRMLRQALQYTLVLEVLGILIMGTWLQWFADPAKLKGINPWWWATFHSISAFCNAGYSLMDDNLSGWVTDPVINLTVAALIILGGLGYPVLIRLWVWIRVQLGGRNGKTTQLIQQLEVVQASRLQTWIALQGTFWLLKLGTLAPLLFDWSNPVYEQYTFAQRVMIAFFHSVSARTAGFNTVDMGLWSTPVLLIFCFLFFVGANPQGTAGGIKITTMRLIFAYIANWFRPPYTHVVVRGRRGEDWLVHADTMRNALRLLLSSSGLCVAATLLLCIFESRYLLTPDPTFNLMKVVFEVFSAFGTVGNSMGYDGGVTSFSGILTLNSKITLALVMMIGRLSPLNVLAIIPWRTEYGIIDLQAAERIKKVQVG